jgi:hypothetical protein
LARVRSGSGGAVFGGVSFPTGDFGATTGVDAGGAQTGFALGVDGSLALAPVLAWTSSAILSVNSADVGQLLAGTGISADAGSWISVWALTGLKVSGALSPEVEISCFGQVGLLYGVSPEITLTAGTARATQKSASATAFGFGVGAGMTFGPVAVGLRYLSGEPEYSVTATGTAGTYSGKVKQQTSCILITGGFVF